MVHIRTEDQIDLIRENALMVTATITEVAKVLRPGITLEHLDKLAETFIRDNGGIPSFKGYGPPGMPFPGSLCLSVNEVVVHGLPSKRELKPGDIISVDCGFYRNGFHGDHAYTFAIGEVPQDVLDMMRITKEALRLGILQARAHSRVGDISWAIESLTSKDNGYGVVRDLVGHGVGRDLHEDPQIPNFGRRGEGKKLKEKSVIAIEPMINLGTREVYTLEDGWTIVTADGKPSCHYEHTTVIRRNGGEALSSFLPIEAAERANAELNTGHLAPATEVAA